MILTPDQLREHVTTALEDDALKRLLDAAEASIIEVAGPPGADVTELVEGGSPRLSLSRPAVAITAVREYGSSTWTTIDPTDNYSLIGSFSVRRAIGYNWGRWVEVTYTPANDAALRMQVQIKLVELELNHPAGLTGTTVGPFQEQFPANSVYNYELERESILSPLRHSPGMVVI